MARNEVRVTITGDAQGLRTSLNQAEGHLAGFSSKMEAIGGKLRSVGETMTLGLTLPIVGALGLGVKWAGELEDAEAMSQQVFGSMSSQVDAWASNSAEAFGLSSGDAIEWANQMGIRLRQIGGLSEEVAATTSQNLVQLAGDFASAFGGSVDEAAQAIGSALTGEFEPLKRYGIVINDAALKNKLFEMTGQEVSGTLTAQQKQMATLALITEQASIVQGDYARNADGATNSQRTMTAALKDAGTTLGTALLPFVTQAAQFVSELANRFQGLSPTLQKVVVVAAVVAAALGPIIYIAGALATAIGFIASPVGLVVAAIAALVAAFVYFYKTNEGFREWVNGVVSALRDQLIAAFNLFKDQVLPQLVAAFDFFKTNVLPALAEAFAWVYERAKPVFEELVPLISAALQAIIGFIGSFVSQGLAFWRTFWPAIEAVVSNVLPGIQRMVESALNFIRGVIQLVTGLISGDWSKAFEGIRNITSSVFNSIRGVFEAAAGILISIVQGLWNVVRSLFSGALNGLRDVVSNGLNGIVSFFSGIPGRIVSAVGNLGSTLYNAGRSVIEGLARGITDRIQGVYDFVSGIAGRIADLKGPLEYDRKLLVPAGLAIMGGLEAGLRRGYTSVAGMVGDLAPNISATVSPAAGTPQSFMTAPTGPSITVNVTAGVGDPAEIGRVVVDTIKAYEQRNGVTWRAA